MAVSMNWVSFKQGFLKLDVSTWRLMGLKTTCNWASKPILANVLSSIRPGDDKSVYKPSCE